MQSKILKDCPHCGSNCLRVLPPYPLLRGYWTISCCECSGIPHRSKQAALAAWNTRALEDAMQAEIVRLKDENERLLRMLGKDAKM